MNLANRQKNHVPPVTESKTDKTHFLHTHPTKVLVTPAHMESEWSRLMRSKT